MPLFSFEGHTPHIHPTAFIAPTASIVGEVTVEEGASVWYGAVLRADYGPVVIRAGANVQDGAVLHATPAGPCEIGARATVAHGAVVHGARIGEEALIGNAATVLDEAVVGRRTLVAAGSLVTPGMQIPDEVMVMGFPAKVRGPLTESAAAWITANPVGYVELAQRHRVGVTQVG